MIRYAYYEWPRNACYLSETDPVGELLYEADSWAEHWYSAQVTHYSRFVLVDRLLRVATLEVPGEDVAQYGDDDDYVGTEWVDYDNWEDVSHYPNFLSTFDPTNH